MTGAHDGTVGDTETADDSTTTAVPDDDDDNSTSGSDSSSGSSSDGPAEPPPFPEECYEPEALIEVTSAITPDGPIQIDEAWLNLDACSGKPFLSLGQAASVEVGPRIELKVKPSYLWRLAEYPISGFYDAEISGLTSQSDGWVDVLEPFDKVDYPYSADASVHLHAQLEFHDDGWDISVEVDVIYCGHSDCLCPCR